MCNVFILAQVLTGIEIGLYIVNIVLTFIGGNLSAQMIGTFVAIGCLILEFIGMKKKHSGLSIFSIVFRCIQFGLAIFLFWVLFGEYTPNPRHGTLFALWIAYIINFIYIAFRIFLQSLVFHKIKKENEQTLPNTSPKQNAYNHYPMLKNYMPYQPQGYVNQGITPEYQNPPPYQNQKA